MIQGLNIPGPGIKIGTIWEGPESAASAAGTHRHPPRHARHPRGAPGHLGGLPDLGTLTGRGSPQKAVCIQVPPLCLLEQRARPSRDVLCPQRVLLSPKEGGVPEGRCHRPQGDSCTRVVSGRTRLSVVPIWSSREWGPCPVPWLSVMPGGRSPKRPVSPWSWLSPVAQIQHQDQRHTGDIGIGDHRDKRGQKHR